MRATIARLLVWAALAAPAGAGGDPGRFSACVGAGCEFAHAPLAPCAAAAANPDTYHVAFARGCIARRDFSRAVVRPAAGARSVEDPERISVDVFGSAEPEVATPTLEARFASALVQGNPEVPGGKIRHGVFHALGVYWGSDPLAFLYYNLRYGLGD